MYKRRIGTNPPSGDATTSAEVTPRASGISPSVVVFTLCSASRCTPRKTTDLSNSR